MFKEKGLVLGGAQFSFNYGLKKGDIEVQIKKNLLNILINVDLENLIFYMVIM